MILTLERMLEPDPDQRAPSIAAALDGVSASAPTHLPVPVAPKGKPGKAPVSNEDAAVKSIRNLLWLLWALGWVIVPLLLREVHGGRYIPLVMFGALASLFVVTWHKGAVIRALLRSFMGKSALGKSTATSRETLADAARNSPRQRVEVADAQRVRVHATEQLRPEELVGNTEVDTGNREEKRRARR